MSSLYIQEFAINTTAITSDQTYLNGVSNVRSTDTSDDPHSYETTGYQWCMDIHNSSTSVLDLSQWRLNICVNYYHEVEHNLWQEEQYIYFRDLIINDNVVGGAVFNAGISYPVSVGDKLYVRPAITINSAHSSGHTGAIVIIGGSSGNISKYNNKKVYHLVGSSFEEIGTVTATATESNTMTIGGGTLRSVSVSDVIYFDSGVTVVSNSGAASQGSSASTVNIPVSNHVSDFVTETIFNESNADNLGTLSSSTILLQGYAPSLITIGYDPSLFGFERLGHTILANYPNATGATGNSNSNSVYHGISSPSSDALKLLPDYEYDTNKYFVSTRFKLERSTNNFSSKTIIDMFGDVAVDGDNYFTNSMVQRILGVSNAISMKKWGVGPTASYDEDANWNGTTANGGPRIFTLSSGAIGDPHISTLTGDHYKFDYLGAFRMFDNNDLDHRIVVNGFSENGPDRWSDKQYITKLYFHENGKSMLITNGFRG